MSLATLSVGPYTMTYTPSSIAKQTTGSVICGLVEGPRVLRQGYTAKMLQSDYYGPGTDIEGIFQGGNCHLSMTLKEWTSVEQAMLWPFATNMGDIGQVGRLLTDLAGSLVLTPVANTPAAVNGPQLFTASKAILAPGNDWNLIMGNDVRDIPIVFQLLPYWTGSVAQWYAITQTNTNNSGMVNGVGGGGSSQSGSGPST
jgi:hypothetical protein